MVWPYSGRTWRTEHTTSQPSVNFSSLMIFANLFSLEIDILKKLVKSRQTLSKAMVARNGFSQ
nr:hypothetical protein CTI12_AA035380, chloroplastic [Tanacetum cinerariifolium]